MTHPLRARILAVPNGGDHMERAAAAGPNTDRIETLDFIRGCVLFGILLMNITGMGLAQAYVNPMNSGGAAGPDLWAWMTTEIGFEGTQRAIFSMLFGAGVILFTTRAEQAGRNGVDLFLRRTLWLLAFGMVNAWVLLWSGDILYGYGLTGLFAVAFRKLSVRHLLAIGAAGLIFMAALGAWDARQMVAAETAARPALAAQKAGKTLTPAQKEAVEAWEKVKGHFVAKPDDVKKEVAARGGGYVSAWSSITSDVAFFQSVFTYRYFFDIFSMMLIGMALLKARILTGEAATGLYAAMMVGGYAIGLSVNLYETLSIMQSGFAAPAFARMQITYDLGRLAMACGHLGLMLLFCRSGLFGFFRRSMAAVGRMALSNYLTHSVVALTLFILFRQFGQFARHELYAIVFAIWAFQFVMSPIWLRHFRFGPVEWLWRALTYLKAPPFRKSSAPACELAPAT